VIRISEALQEKTIARIADHIAEHRDNLRLILIAGPSSSGKTSFAQRLRVQLLVNGLEPVSISLDDYFRNRVDTPKNEKGEYDYECLEALDTELFNAQMVALLKGEEVDLPHYKFLTGLSERGTGRTSTASASSSAVVATASSPSASPLATGAAAGVSTFCGAAW
jgi:uridine kinase